MRRTRSSHPWSLVTRHPWRVTVRRIDHPFPPLFDVIGSCGCREFRTDDLR
jgi:hypothetical protein